MKAYTVKLRVLHDVQQAIKSSTAKRKIVKAGRRGGKTVVASDIAVEEFLAGRRVLYAAPTGDQLTKWWFEVVSALKEPIEAGVYKKNESNHSIELPGTENRLRGKTAWDEQTMRGDYADVLILDEVQSMHESVWDEVGAPMLLDNNGDAVFIWTPPSLKSRFKSRAKNKMWVVDMWKAHENDARGRWELFSFTSFDNPYISREALDEISEDMTALAYRQEILAEAIMESPGALWKRDTIDKYRVTEKPKEFRRIGVGLDPSLTSGGDDAGIIVGGVGYEDKEYYVLDDKTINGSPLAWAKEAILAYVEWDADYIVIEKNAGGEMIELTVEQAKKDLIDSGMIKEQSIRIVYVNASRGKQVRADPVSAMYERGLVHHVGHFFDLEDELCLWTPGDASPNRLDALVWVMYELSGRGDDDFGGMGKVKDFKSRWAD